MGGGGDMQSGGGDMQSGGGSMQGGDMQSGGSMQGGDKPSGGGDMQSGGGMIGGMISTANRRLGAPEDPSMAACDGSSEGTSCSFDDPNGNGEVTGTCTTLDSGDKVCKGSPSDGGMPDPSDDGGDMQSGGGDMQSGGGDMQSGGGSMQGGDMQSGGSMQ